MPLDFAGDKVAAWQGRKIALLGPGIVGMPMAALLAAAKPCIGQTDPARVLVVRRDSPTSGWKVDAINNGRSVIGGVEPGLDDVVRRAVADGVLAADGLIGLSKLKAHGLTRLTGAVKNQFGCIPGILKGQFHARIADPYTFATMLVDLNTLVRPRLYVMDAVMAMEGNGPRSGRPKPLNALLFSRDPIALDAIACKMIDLDPEFVPTSKPGELAGLGTYRYENIKVVGDNLVRVMSWYDNEWGFSCRMSDTAVAMANAG